MRTLIVGAGVAGLTLAGLMHRRGERPVVVERSKDFEHLGYMLGLYYLGSRVLHGLGLFEEYLSRSVATRRYEVRNGRGELIRSYDLTGLIRRYGPLQGIGRGTLIDLLREGLGDLPIRMGTAVRSLEQREDIVEATFDDGSSGEFDLVVTADGLHSDTRSMVLSEEEYAYRKTGWSGWVFWTDPTLAPRDTYTECWGAGRFLGLYPTKDRLGVFLGGPTRVLEKLSLMTLAQDLCKRFKATASSIAEVLETVDATTTAYLWSMEDCRAKLWRKGRVVLLGDAGTGFLPTAGIGASMAMESAAALNDELSRTNSVFVERALDLYEIRRRKREEEAQETSRRLGQMMFITSPCLAWGRDQLVKLYTLRMFIKSIAAMMDAPI